MLITMTNILLILLNLKISDFTIKLLSRLSDVCVNIGGFLWVDLYIYCVLGFLMVVYRVSSEL